MEWKHKCSLDWLKERQKYLTATDIKSLLPVTKTGRPRKITDMDRLKVFAKKRVELTEEDCWSYGAAARGHLLEPYAIDALNDYLTEMCGATRQEFFHWDDKVINITGSPLAFSPDAMDVMQLNAFATSAHKIAEVKSYAPDKHLLTGFTPKEEIEERWQIATAMATLDSIEEAYLVLFNPSMKTYGLFVIKYYRDDLSDEIEIVRKIANEWVDFLFRQVKLPIGTAIYTNTIDEQDIVSELERAQRLNPV